MAVSLTSKDVTKLLAEPSAAVRAELAEKVGSTLAGAQLAPGEIALAHDIVQVLAWDVEEQVRAALSRALRHARTLPRDIATKLADDIDWVALPMLADSLVLSDEDLIEIVRHGSLPKQETIAGRPNLNEAVSDALVIHAGEPAVVVLMGNRTAAISEASLNRAVNRFRGSERVTRAMVLRDSLPATVSERLVALVSKTLQEVLVQTHALSPKAAADIVLASREHAVIRLSAGSSDEELRRMVTQMEHNGRLTPTLMLRALCTGDIAFFEAAMAAKGDVPLENAQILIHDRSRMGLAALYRKAHLPEGLLPAVRAAVDVVGETGFDGNPRDLERFRARVISRLLTSLDPSDPSDSDYLLDKLGDVLVHAPDPAAYLPNHAEPFAGALL
jgi:uncharacterized protein (DUF2336 family)